MITLNIQTKITFCVMVEEKFILGWNNTRLRKCCQNVYFVIFYFFGELSL